MPKFPEPRAHLAAVPADPYVLAVGTELWHVYFQGGAHPRAWHAFRSFGPVPTARFDHHRSPPREQERAIYYGGTLASLCIAEVFQTRRLIDRRSNEPWLVGFRLARDVTLLNLSGLWPTRAGASMAISSGSRARSQRWSVAIYDAYPGIDGLWYSSSMYQNDPALALYERARDAVANAALFFHQPLAARGLIDPLFTLARQIGYELL